VTDPELTRLLKQAIPPLGGEPPRRDLWTDVRARLDRGERRVNWLDWVIATAAAAGFAALPELLPALLYLL
jgi:hypothetical protein